MPLFFRTGYKYNSSPQPVERNITLLLKLQRSRLWRPNFYLVFYLFILEHIPLDVIHQNLLSFKLDLCRTYNKMTRPSTCCNLSGDKDGCVCAAQAKCACGKQPASACDCGKSTSVSGPKCSCSRLSFHFVDYPLSHRTLLCAVPSPLGPLLDIDKSII